MAIKNRRSDLGGFEAHDWGLEWVVLLEAIIPTMPFDVASKFERDN
ncbi:hypothetical protein [Comamonas humi]